MSSSVWRIFIHLLLRSKEHRGSRRDSLNSLGDLPQSLKWEAGRLRREKPDQVVSRAPEHGETSFQLSSRSRGAGAVSQVSARTLRTGGTPGCATWGAVDFIVSLRRKREAVKNQEQTRRTRRTSHSSHGPVRRAWCRGSRIGTVGPLRSPAGAGAWGAWCGQAACFCRQHWAGQ